MKEALNVEIEEIQIKNQILSSGIDLNTAVTLMPHKQLSKDLVVQPRKEIELEKKRKRKKSSSKRKIKIIVISVISIIVICIGVILANNILFNNAIYNQANAENSTIISAKTYFNNIVLQEKTIQAIKANNKSLQIEFRDSFITISSDKISKNLKLGLNIKNNGNNIPQFDGKQYLYIQNAPYSSISAKLPEYLKDKKIVDIYTVKENNNIEIYKKSVNINENQTVTIDLVEDAIGYAVIYIPLEDLVIEQQNEKICISQNEPSEIKFKCVPENATSTHLKYITTEEGIIVNEENKLVGTKNGEYTVKVINENNEVEKVINVNVVVSSNGENPTEPVYIQGILIANKTYKLPKTYNPGLQPEVLKAFKKMKSDAAKEGLKLRSVSDFRSYKVQSQLYKSYVARSGKEAADTFSARPGYSEHQTGLAIDVNASGDEFANTPESAWLAENAHKYGFIIRYPYGKESITGYKYEPWHIRYLGVETATDVYNSGLCLEEYLGITSEYQE